MHVLVAPVAPASPVGCACAPAGLTADCCRRPAGPGSGAPPAGPRRWARRARVRSRRRRGALTTKERAGTRRRASIPAPTTTRAAPPSTLEAPRTPRTPAMAADSASTAAKAPRAMAMKNPGPGWKLRVVTGGWTPVG